VPLVDSTVAVDTETSAESQRERGRERVAVEKKISDGHRERDR
jgi:hypothetical protein